MAMRRSAVMVACLAAVPGLAAADTFGGFSKLDRSYLVNTNKVCQPIKVTAGAGTGAPKCATAKTDEVAKLDIEAPTAQAGTSATFAASAAQSQLTVSKKAGNAVVVAWKTMDPIERVVDVFSNKYQDRVAVTYVTRVAGKEVTNVVAFDIQGATPPTVTGKIDTPPTVVDTPPVAVDPKVDAAVKKARKAGKSKAIAAWTAVLALDPDNSEAMYGIAVAQGKKPKDAVATLQKLRASTRPDAIEWLVQARFDSAFANLRTDPDYRAAVGIGAAPTNTYERLMGLGGQWEQTGTPCDKPEVHFTLNRDRSFKLRVKTACDGMKFDSPFKGTWAIQGTTVVLTVPTSGKATTEEDQAACQLVTQGDEDALTCSIGRDIDFSVLPTRR